MWSHILRRPCGDRWKIGRVKCKAPVRVPAGELTGSVRWASSSMAPGRCTAGARSGAVRCTELCVLWHPLLLYLKLRCTFWDAVVRGPHGQYSFQMALGRQTPRCCAYHSGLSRGREGAVGYTHAYAARRPYRFVMRIDRKQIVMGPSRRPYGLINCPGARRNFTAAGRTPAENSQNVCFYSPYGPRRKYVKAPLESRVSLSNLT